MTKEIDESGFWLYRNTPISKEGVFPYLGEQISANLEPKKIYNVYRPFSELVESIDSFNGKPLSDDHDMLGDGFMPYDEKPASGTLYNIHAENGRLYGDIRVFSEAVKNKIESGKKELSLGYFCEYEPEKGVFNGQEYDFVQKRLRGNHIALVDRGRMGSDVRVYDRAITMDSIDIETIPSKDGEPEKSRGVNGSIIEKGVISMEKSYTKATIDAALKACSFDEDDIEKVGKKLEETSADEEVKEEEKKETEDSCSKDACGKDEEETKEEEKPEEPAKGEDADETEKSDKEEEEKGEDADEEEEKEDDDKKSAEDSARAVIREMDARNALKDDLRPIIGSFAADGMTQKDIAVYGCKKLGLSVSEDEALPTLKGYLACNKKSSQVFGLDSEVKTTPSMDKALINYMK